MGIDADDVRFPNVRAARETIACAEVRGFKEKHWLGSCCVSYSFDCRMLHNPNADVFFEIDRAIGAT